MLTRVFIIGLLLFILYSLGAGLFYMLKDKGRSDRTLKALSWRIGISVFLFVMLLIGMATGVITPQQNPLGMTPQ